MKFAKGLNMSYVGHACALGAGTIVNAISTWKGAAFAVDLKTFAHVELEEGEGLVSGKIEGLPDSDTRLIERTVQLIAEYFGMKLHGKVTTNSEIPLASGLKSSSAAANATILATLNAIDKDIASLDAIKIGVKAALDVGVSITGAFDDACASFLGGVVVTDNKTRELELREEMEREVLIFSPYEKAFSAATNVKRSNVIAPWVNMAYKLALEGKYEKAMTLNGFLYCNALGFSSEPLITALEIGIMGVTLSGTGPSYVALVNEKNKEELIKAWSKLNMNGNMISTKIINNGARNLVDCDHK